jgi:hypothetical protein
MKIASLLAAAALISLSSAGVAAASAAPAQDDFLARLNALCGQRFEGRVVTTDTADARFASERLTMHVRDCSADEVRIPFAVGSDRSRTWVVTRTDAGLRLKHDHRHEDGTTDVLHWYGGDTANAGTAERQEFPVDAESVALFNANDAAVSTTNVWAMEVHPDRIFAYELRRTNRHFRVEFDLTKPIKD